mgnify:FL=1
MKGDQAGVLIHGQRTVTVNPQRSAQELEEFLNFHRSVTLNEEFVKYGYKSSAPTLEWGTATTAPAPKLSDVPNIISTQHSHPGATAIFSENFDPKLNRMTGDLPLFQSLKFGKSTEHSVLSWKWPHANAELKLQGLPITDDVVKTTITQTEALTAKRSPIYYTNYWLF